jgi:hypothetical protein
MSGRIFPLGLILCVAAAPIAGCSLTQKQTVDFAQFKAAKKLSLVDRGPGGDGTADVKRSAEVSDAHVIAQVTALLDANARDWKEVPFSKPCLRFTLSATTQTEIAEWVSFEPGYDATAEVYIQKNRFYTHISMETFQRLLVIFGARDWLENPPADRADRAGQGATAQQPRPQR